MSTLVRHLQQTFRNLAKAPGFTLTTLAVLALGIGVTTAMFSVLYAAVLRPLPFPDADRLVACASTFKGVDNPITSAPDYYDFREGLGSFQGLAAQFYSERRAVLQGAARPETAPLLEVSDNFFATFGVQPLAGRAFLPAEGVPGSAPVILMGERLARSRFGSPAAAVGHTLTVDGLVRTVIGVIPGRFRFLTEAELWTPMQRGAGSAGAPRNFHNWWLVGRLRPGVTLQTAQAEANAVASRLEQTYPEFDRSWGLRLASLQGRIVRDQKPRLHLLMGAVTLLLLMACTNVAGLLFVRGTAKGPEYAIRAALGASRGQLIALILSESVVLSLAGGALGCLLAFWLMRLIPMAAELSALGIPPPDLAWPVLLFALLIALATGLLFGLLPALRISRDSLNAQLLPSARSSEHRRGVRTRNGLVVAQVALAMVLLATTGLMGRSLSRLLSTDPGFRADGLLTAQVRLTGPRYQDPKVRERFFRNLREELSALPGVRGVGLVNQLPILQGGNTYDAWNPEVPLKSVGGIFHLRVIAPGYFATMGIPLLAGRSLGEEDQREAPPTMVINRRMAQALFPGQSPLGRTVLTDLGEAQPSAFQVAGVVGDVHLDSLDARPDMAMYVSSYQRPGTKMSFALRTELSPASLTPAILAIMARLDPELPLDSLVPMAAILHDHLAPQREAAFTMGLFSAAALLLSSLGLFSVLSFVVAQRTREIGVRLALGAQPTAVVRQVLGDCLLLTAMGIALGYLGSLAASRVLGHLLFEVRPMDPLVMITAALAVAAVSVAAALLPAWKAARVNPMEVFRAT